MNTKTCTICNNEKDINNFYKKYSECIDCNRARGLKRYYENKDKISNQQKVYYEKNREKILLQKQNNRSIQFRDLVISYIELENRLKALEEKLNVYKNINDSEKHLKIYKRNLFQTTKKVLCHKQNRCLSH